MILPAVFTLALAVEAAAATSPAPSPAASPAPSAPKSDIVGVWKGSSICAKVEGNEFCHDETVVYNFIDVPDKPTTVALKAARVVDGTVEPMYELYFNWQPATGLWTCEFTRSRFNGVWAYAVHGDAMTGTATIVPSNKVVRNVTAKRTSRGALARAE
jgi:hypothetical protein